ncbi:hypothetical protein AYO49_03105 [Verrucomicrobiaceae bacterium SCGC AG-212-N21]|nr:hypothetical protein AYO49_03105 [Verrucomicrobiaceae bacterium SCGC AG-212-N21]
MTLLHAPATVFTRVRQRNMPAPRELEMPSEGRTHKVNPQTSVSAFRSFALEAHVHVDDITAEETVRLMLAFYRHVRAPEGLLEEGGDVLHYEWGLSRCGEAELFHIELSREFTEAGQDENNTSRLTIGLHYKPTFTLRAIREGSLWCSSRADEEAFGRSIRSGEAYWALAKLPPAEVALEWTLV